MKMPRPTKKAEQGTPSSGNPITGLALTPARGGAITMSSLELVDFINEQRAQKAFLAGAPFPSKGHAKLEHKHFLDKVPEVLGEGSAEFSADLPDSYGRTRRGYRNRLIQGECFFVRNPDEARDMGSIAPKEMLQ